MTKYTPRYFIEKFAAIPDEQWTTKAFTDANGAHCALGHCGYVSLGQMTKEARALGRLLYFTPGINDGVKAFAELGDTPKERILNALILVEAGVWEELYEAYR